MKRKILAMVVAGAVLLSSGAVFAASTLNKWISKDGSVIDQVNYPVYVNGVKMDMVDPVTGKSQVVLGHNGRTYVPLRKVAEAVGADSNSMWDTSDPTKPHVDIITPEHSKPTDYIQTNMFPNGKLVSHAIRSNDNIKAKAKQLVAGKTSKHDKAMAIFNWIVNNISYKMVDNDYDGLPDSVGAEYAFNTKTGICYDYASLYAVMCDAVNLNVRLVGGYAQNEFVSGGHAWNEVQMDNGGWINIDTTWGDFGFTASSISDPSAIEVPDGRYSTNLFAEFENY